MPALSCALLLVGTACGLNPAAGKVDSAADARLPVRPVAVSAEQFAESTRHVLLDAPSSERTNLLVGVVRHQLDRAADRFRAGKRAAGVAALTGAFYLTRAGEFRPEMIEGASLALLAAAAEMARIGDAGRAVALYTMLEETLPRGAERDDVRGHLAALGNWAKVRGNAGPLVRVGTAERALVARAMLETSPELLEKATDATIALVQEAQRANVGEFRVNSPEDREEALEGYRAMRAGGPLIVALHLRHGSAEGSLRALERADMFPLIPPRLKDRLELAAEDRAPDAWMDLFKMFNDLDGEPFLPDGIARAASWGAAVELYRTRPDSPDATLPLAVLMVEQGMAEVAPHIMVNALGEAASADELSRALGLVLHAMAAEESIGEIGAARRVFANATPIIERAASPRFRGKVTPSAARVRYVMGSLETRAADLKRAKPLIEAALGDPPSIDALTVLAAIDRQRGDYAAAQQSLNKIIAATRKAGDALAEAEALATLFEIERDQGRARAAAPTLRAALARVLDARSLVRSAPKQAQAERVLARILDHFRLAEAARRATERAYKASRADTRQFTATVLDAARRALTQGDLPSAREAVQHAIDAGLQDEDMVYVALWLHLLEKRLGVSSDGTAEEAFTLIEGSSGWPARLRSWALGKLSDAALLESAQTTSHKTEAQFYAAMAKDMRGAGVWNELKAVAASEAIELVEVTIARDLVASRSPAADLKLTADLVLP